jgi:hypothetical protein
LYGFLDFQDSKLVKFILSWSMFLQVCTAKMNLGDEVDLEDYVSRPDKISAAEVFLVFPFLILSQILFDYNGGSLRI